MIGAAVGLVIIIVAVVALVVLSARSTIEIFGEEVSSDTKGQR